MTSQQLEPVEKWMSSEALGKIYSAEYWNDVEEERKKEWWIAEGDYKKCLSYLDGSGLLAEWRIAEKCLKQVGQSNLEVADLACGIGWTSALLSRLDAVGTVHATDISEHRLTGLFPHAVAMLEGCPHKVRRYLGSFYELGFKNESIDVVFLSHGFHHADQPLRLLVEIDRVLRKGGWLLMIGEEYVSLLRIARRFIGVLLREKRICTNFYELFPPNALTGDHYYRVSDYQVLFQLLGYKAEHHVVNGRTIVLTARKHYPEISAPN